MRLSIKVAGWPIVANMVFMTAPSMIVVGFGGWPLQPWLPPMAHDDGFNLTMLAGFLWPIGVPFVVWAMDRWKPRLSIDVYCALVGLAFYVWAVLVTLATLLMMAEWVPTAMVSGLPL